MTRKRDELLDHDADGIREFDNDLPRWWTWAFYITIIWSVLYVLNYHVLSSPFLGDRTIAAEYDAEVAAAQASKPPAPAPAAAASGSATDGKALFEAQGSLCVTCHRADLGGLVGPDLTDAFWLHGCTPSAVAESITVGFPTKGMPAFGGGAVLSDEQVGALVRYILSKRGTAPAGAKAKDPERDVECK